MILTLDIGNTNIVIGLSLIHILIAIVSPEAAPVKRLVQEAKAEGNIIDATCGRKTRAVIICDSGHVVLSALMTDTILMRLQNFKDTEDE